MISPLQNKELLLTSRMQAVAQCVQNVQKTISLNLKHDYPRRQDAKNKLKLNVDYHLSQIK
jgi:hypothetical protein